MIVKKVCCKCWYRNKSFLEDIFILFVIGVLIYGIYSIFFSSEEKVEQEENRTFIEKSVEQTPKEIVDEKKIEDELEKKEELTLLWKEAQELTLIFQKITSSLRGNWELILVKFNENWKL